MATGTGYRVEAMVEQEVPTLLHPTMTDKELEDGIAIALKYNTASVCIKPYAVKKAAALLLSSNVAVCTVIGFPHGSNTETMKVAETVEACKNGAVEIDMVVNVGKVLGGDWDYVDKEISADDYLTKYFLSLPQDPKEAIEKIKQDVRSNGKNMVSRQG
jgi:deoxyribose-phosphate aldolase